MTSIHQDNDQGWPHWLDHDTRSRLESEWLPEFVRRQRWFAGKARGLASVRLVDATAPSAFPVPHSVPTLVEVTHEDGGSDLYFLPLLQADAAAIGPDRQQWVIGVPDPRTVILDALADPDTAAAWLALIERDVSLPMRLGTLRGLPTAAFDAVRGPADDPLLAVYRAIEQSNSALIYGDRMFLKVFRRLTPGIHPDFEIGRFLSERSSFDRVPRAAGALIVDRGPNEPITVAILQEWVRSVGTGWDRALAALDAYYRRAEMSPEPAPTEPTGMSVRELAESGAVIPNQAVILIGGELNAATMLGRRTGELHVALASEPTDPAYTPEPMLDEDLALVVEEVRAQVQQTLEVLEARLDRVSPNQADDARRVLDHGPVWERSINQLRNLSPSGIKIRIHGDYHLGQVLRTADDDFYVLDFEGEPSKSLSRRRAKQSPLKDVVGMLRSFDYAAFAGLFAFAQGRPEVFERLVPWARTWRTWTSVAFLRGYLATTGGSVLVPTDTHYRGVLIDALTLDKAMYELLYELNNRPDWVRIPLQGIVALLQRADQAAAAPIAERG
jgi:maltose alpha-D-glucosyltransferase/alpha-amylase